MNYNTAKNSSSQDANTLSPPADRTLDVPRQTISPDLSQKLTTVSFLAAIGVVFIHAHPPFSQTARSEISLFFELLISWPFTLWAVPIFFVISGYLFAIKTELGQKPHWYSETLKKRSKSIFIPYILWCIIYVLTVVLYKVIGNIHAGRPALLYTGLNEPLFSIKNLLVIFGLDLSRSPIGGVLWYLRNLMMLFLVSPIFMFFMKRRRVAVPWLLLFLAAFGILYSISIELITTLWGGVQIQSLFYFQFGVFLAFYPPPRAFSHAFRLILPVFWLIVGVAATWFIPYNRDLAIARILLWLSSLSGVGAIWLLPDLIPALRRIGRWSVAKDSFFLYLFHCVILDTIMGPSMEKAFEVRLHVPVFGLYLLRFIIPFCLSLIAAELLKRFLPKVYRFLVGGR